MPRVLDAWPACCAAFSSPAARSAAQGQDDPGNDEDDADDDIAADRAAEDHDRQQEPADRRQRQDLPVEDNNLTVQISALRRILDQGRAEGSCIQTVAGRGYRFVATVSGAAALPPPRLSIVVLPFTNLSNYPDQEYLADGITDDLTTDLSRMLGSFVIARSTAFTYKGKAVGVKQIGRELGVHYVLEGSVRRSGSQIRVNIQLIDAETEAHLWADRFDRYTGDLFSLQDDITSRIAVALNLELIGAEADRPAAHPDALDYILRGRATLSKPSSRYKYADAISLFERALTLDAGSVEAQSWLAIALAGRALDQMTDSAAAYIALAEGLIDRALATSPRLLQARFARGEVLRTQGRYKKAIPDYETVLALNRNWVNALYALGQCKLMAGWIEEAIPLVEQAIHLSPRDPFIALWYLWIGRVHLVQSSTDEAILWLEKARSANPELAGPSRLPRVRLCPEKRYRTRRHRACRSPAAEQRRSFLEHCPFGK